MKTSSLIFVRHLDVMLISYRGKPTRKLIILLCLNRMQVNKSWVYTLNKEKMPSTPCAGEIIVYENVIKDCIAMRKCKEVAFVTLILAFPNF